MHPFSLASKVKLALRRSLSKCHQTIQRIDASLQLHPVLLGSSLCCIKTIIADYFAQSVMDKKSFSDINWRRNYLFALFGFFYAGMFQYGLYSKLYPMIYKSISHWHWFPYALIQSVLDKCFHTQFIYFPTFYIFKSIVYDGFSINNCKNSVNTYIYKNWKQDMISAIRVWIPVNIITFGIIPPYLRVPWVSAVSFVWIVMLSMLRGNPNEIIDNKIKDGIKNDHRNLNGWLVNSSNSSSLNMTCRDIDCVETL